MCIHEETFDVRSFCQLLEAKFNIPSYQRGYRWEERQVTELLDDWKEFIDTIESDKGRGQFYCLQPIVVRRNPQQPAIYDVIDGQQRLTTIYLIMQYLYSFMHSPIYSIEYDRHRQEDECYLSKNLFWDDNDEKGLYKKNADNFYIYKAYQTIVKWFSTNDAYKQKIAQLLTKKSENVRVIWYELPQNDDDTQAIDAFARLNEGKIALTNAELVKALLLQCANEDRVKQEVAMRRAMEWDAMEKQLQDPLFWAMLTSAKYNPSSHIELVIDFVAQNIAAKDKDKYPYQKDKNLYSFLVINKAIAIKAETVETIWAKIQDTYTVFRNWYYELDMYHLVGLWNLLNGDNTLHTIQEVYDICKDKTQTDAKEQLRKKIGAVLKVNNLESINYVDDAKQIISILEAFNVYLHISRTNSTDRFRFDLFKQFNVTSLEHIHPQNLDTDSMKAEEISSWLHQRREAIKDCNKDDVLKAADELENLLKENKNTKENNTSEILKRVKIIDSEFDELAGMKPEQMHTLYNMALVDKDTNAALSNNFLYKKRDVLRKREEREERENKTYVPVGTWAAFNKLYSDEVLDMKFWSPNDRKAYFKEIETAYLYFVNETKK